MKFPPTGAGQRIKLRFDTVHSDCRVFVNGREVGAHEGCFTAFELDLTDAVKPGRNTLALAVKNESIADTLASATQYAAHQLGGITRKVQLFALPPVNLAGQIVETKFDEKFENATLALKLSVADESPAQATGRISVRATLFAGAKTVVTATRDVPAGSGAVELSLPVAAPKKWDSEHPNLYLLKTELLAGDRLMEEISQRVGFRQIEVRGNQLFVNGTPVKLRGACRHEVDPMRGRSLTPETWRQDAELFRAANVNYIRTSHYPPPEEFLDWCDEYGFFVECEAPLCWVQHGANSIWQKWNYQDKSFSRISCARIWKTSRQTAIIQASRFGRSPTNRAGVRCSRNKTTSRRHNNVLLNFENSHVSSTETFDNSKNPVARFEGPRSIFRERREVPKGKRFALRKVSVGCAAAQPILRVCKSCQKVFLRVCGDQAGI